MKKICAKLDNGLDLTLKVINTLRRKEFDINDLEMKNNKGEISLFITLKQDDLKSLENATFQMEKIYGVSDIKII